MAGGFICNLVLGICDFRHKTPRQSHLISDLAKGPGFSGQNKNIYATKTFHAEVTTQCSDLK